MVLNVSIFNFSQWLYDVMDVFIRALQTEKPVLNQNHSGMLHLRCLGVLHVRNNHSLTLIRVILAAPQERDRRKSGLLYVYNSGSI